MSVELLKKTLEQNKEKYISRLADLVACETQCIGHGILGGHEANGQEYLQKLFAEMGADVEKDQLKEEIILKALAEFNEGNTGHNYDDRYNLYASFKGEGSGKSLMFNGHLDTMPHGDKSLWTSDPLIPEIRDGRMYGVGVCDMKGGLMAAISAVQLLKDAGIKVPGEVKFTAVADEEGGGNGSIQAAMNGQKADGVIVCEPSDHTVKIAHNGFVFFKVEVSGLACHSGSKWLGVSAIEKAIKIIHALEELEHKWLMNYIHPLLPSPTGNVGEIEGGKAGSTVADYCCFKTCVHYIPGMTHDQLVGEYTDAINLCCDGDEWLKEHRPTVSIYQAGGSFEVDPDHPVIHTLQSSFKDVVGEDLIPTGLKGGCDSRVWQNIAKCPTIHYGPGSLSVCHTVDENLSMDEYLECILVYAQMIINWCK